MNTAFSFAQCLSFASIQLKNASLCSENSVKPTLKKVSKYENKFAKLQKKAAEFNFRNQLKVVKKKEFTLEEEEKEVCISNSEREEKYRFDFNSREFALI